MKEEDVVIIEEKDHGRTINPNVLEKLDSYLCTSKASKHKLNISDCKLMHLQHEGVLRAVKKGQSFYYHLDDILNYNKNRDREKS